MNWHMIGMLPQEKQKARNIVGGRLCWNWNRHGDEARPTNPAGIKKILVGLQKAFAEVHASEKLELGEALGLILTDVVHIFIVK